MPRPKLLVTGAAGYLGRHVVRQARLLDYEVHATWRRAVPPVLADVALHVIDLADAEATRQLVRRLAPAAVVHTAYAAAGAELVPVTELGSAAVAGACAEVGARLVHLSTDVVFDGEKPGPYVEDDPVNPITAYGRAKARAEAAVLALCPSAVAVRTSLLYGGDEPGPQERLVQRALHTGDDPPPGTVRFFTDEIRCPVQVGDLATAVLELAGSSVSGVLHVAGAEAVNRHELAWLLATAMGLDARGLQAATSAEASGEPRPRNCALDTSLARSLLTTKVRGVHEVLARP
jgi:dTDP-4-dehydrorhamnose reductase